MAAVRRGTNKVSPAFSMGGAGAEMESIKNLAALFTICMIMIVAFGNVGGAMAAGEDSSAPSPSMESAAITLFVPALMAVCEHG
ncbi:unnamed protein product [Withania somnifera]